MPATVLSDVCLLVHLILTVRWVLCLCFQMRRLKFGEDDMLVWEHKASK